MIYNMKYMAVTHKDPTLWFQGPRYKEDTRNHRILVFMRSFGVLEAHQPMPAHWGGP